MARTTSLPRRQAAPGAGSSILRAMIVASAIACGGERSRGTETAAADSSLPALPLDSSRDSGERPPHEATADTGAESADPAMGVPGALAVLKRYFEEINTHEFHEAYHLWSDDGAASGLTLEEFARGYDRTRSTTFATGSPGRIEGAAGSRYIEVPITIEAITVDGVHQHFAGRIVLRRVVVPGAANEERSWHIYSAAIQEVR